MTRRAAALALAVSMCGCGSGPPQSGPRQAYRGSMITAAGDEIPFFLELPANCNTERASIVNGTERISIPCQRLGGRVLVDFVVYGTRISADVGEGGDLAGQWSHSGGNFTSADRVRFAAQPIDRIDPAMRFGSTHRPGAIADSDIAGIWKIAFDSGESAKAVFRMTGDRVVHGTAEVPSEYGDLRFLAGTIEGPSLRLSTFDGAGAYLIRSEVDAPDRMRGELIRADGSRNPFAAVRSDDFDVVDPLQRVRVTSPDRRLDLPPLLKAPYAGKPVIVELFGTWCSNCNDLAPLLAELYRRHHAEGLEILGISYEISADAAYVRDRVAEYRAAHGVEWEVLIPSAPPEELFAAGPARLSSVAGVPVTFFFNRDRTVHAIYTGFSGPATGGSHQRAMATFRRLTKEILASR